MKDDPAAIYALIAMFVYLAVVFVKRPWRKIDPHGLNPYEPTPEEKAQRIEREFKFLVNAPGDGYLIADAEPKDQDWHVRRHDRAMATRLEHAHWGDPMTETEVECGLRHYA